MQGAPLRPAGRLQMPAVLAACALLAGLGTAALVRPWQRPPPKLEIAQVVQPELAPSVPPPPAVAVEPPPPAVVAAQGPDASVAAKAPERPPSGSPTASQPDADRETVGTSKATVDTPRRGRVAPQDRAAHPSPAPPKREVRSIRRPKAADPAAEVEETGSAASKSRPTMPTPSSSAHAPTWNLPSVLRPGGM